MANQDNNQRNQNTDQNRSQPNQGGGQRDQRSGGMNQPGQQHQDKRSTGGGADVNKKDSNFSADE